MTRGALAQVLPGSARRVQRLSWNRPDGPAVDAPAGAALPADAELCALCDVPPGAGVVLLGESGMGKTTALAQLRAVWESTGAFDHVLVVDLELVRDAAGFDMLISAELRRCMGVFALEDKAAASGARPRVLLVLDHVDRCGLGTLLFGTLMVRLVRDPETRGFTLLTACRDTDWPVALTEQLCRVMPGLEALRLLPLRRSDVAALAEISRLDPEDFLAAVETAGVWPLAEIPMSANLLIKLFHDNVQLPSDPASLYEQGLQALAEDRDTSWNARRNGHRPTGLAAPRKLAVAARIAAWLQLCGYPAVTTVAVADVDPVDLPHWETVGGSEPDIGGALSIDENVVYEVLGCGLFTSMRPERHAVRHESFTAFLTARYLHHRKFTEKQLRALLLASERAGAKVHPLLRESAAWLVALDPVTHRWIAEADAEAVASFPYAVAHVAIRPVLVDGLLDLADGDLLRNRDFSGLKIDRLRHPGLASQLGVALATRSMLRGRAAAMLAEACRVHEARPDLIAAARDEACDPSLRVRAVLAASALGRSATAAQLRSLLTDPAEVSDELRGALLEATWPEALSAAELVAALGPETRPTVFDLYALFLLRLHERLGDEDLPEVLRWAAGRAMAGDGVSVRRGARRTAELCDRLITRAWKASDRALVLPALSELVLERLEEDLHVETAKPLAIATTGDVEDRRTLVRLVLQRAQGRASIPRLAASPLSRRLGLIAPADLPWLLEQEATADASFVPRWQLLIRFCFDAADPRHLRAAQAVSGSRVWHNVLAPLLETGQGGPAIEALHASVAADLEAAQAENADDEPAERTDERREILDALTTAFARAEAGDLDAFWQLCRGMRFDPSSGSEAAWWSDDVTARPGYRALQTCCEDFDARFETLAQTYLHDHHPHTEEWIHLPRVVSWPAECGYLAFALLDRRRPAVFEALDDSVWATWAPAILAFDPSLESTGEAERKHRYLRLLRQRTPQSVVEPFRRIMQTACEAGAITHLLRFAESCWSTPLADAVAEELPALAAADPKQTFDEALGLLVAHEHPGAAAFALNAVRDETGEAAQELGRRVALLMLCTNAATSFTEVFEQMRRRPAWGRTVAEGMARAYAPTDPLSRLEDAQLATLYRWMLEQYPPEADSFEPGFQFTSAEQDTRFWRERAAQHLMDRGTLAAIDELAALADENPHRPWLRRMLATARGRYRAASWIPVHLSDLRAMAEDTGRRYARDENDLREAVLEQLGRLQERMRGKTPEAYFLWNENRLSKANSKWRPKYEPELSDYVAVHLETHLRHVFTNREVEVERTTSTGMGERVDLLCQAFDPADRDRAARYQIVIEVKGCWNERLEADLHDQLSADYMPKVGTRHGIYLVGYFPKSQWDSQESRYKKTRERSAEQLKAELDLIAEGELAETGNRISVFVLDMSRPESRRAAASRRR